MFLKVIHALMERGIIMKLNKKAAIKTAKITLGFISLIVLFSIILANITIEVFLSVVFIILLGVFIRAIYQVCLSDIECPEIKVGSAEAARARTPAEAAHFFGDSGCQLM